MTWKLRGNGVVRVVDLSSGEEVDRPDIAEVAKKGFEDAVKKASPPHLSVVRDEEDEE